MAEIDYKSFVGKRINTKFGPAKIESSSGRYGTLSYENVDGIGWVDLSGPFEIIE